MAGFTKKVLKVTQSPMNPKRWCLDLECGHEQWVTSNKKPTRKTISCDRCFGNHP